MRFQWRYVFSAFLLLAIVYTGYRWYGYRTEPVGQITGTTLTLNGMAYVAEPNTRPIQRVFPTRVGRTDNGGTICAINGESPSDFVYVIGDMWEGTYRRETIPPPAITASDVATMISGTQTSNDPTLVTQIVQDLHSKDTSSLSDLMRTSGYNLHGIDVRLKSHPGLTFPLLFISRNGHMYFETNAQNGTGLNIDGTPLQKFLQTATTSNAP
jgi:hypothetical protein